MAYTSQEYDKNRFSSKNQRITHLKIQPIQR